MKKNIIKGNNKIKKTSIKLKPMIKLIIYIVLFLAFSALMYYITHTIYIKMDKDKNTFIMNYSNNMTLNYKVCIHENPYYLDDCLQMDKQYPYSIIDEIKYNINNTLIASKNMKITYTYQITANMISETVKRNVLEEELWNKEYVLVPAISNTITSNRIEINQDFNIDYEYYENIMEEYRQTFQVPMQAYLKIRYKLNLDNNEENIHEEISLYSTIPLLKPVVKITNDIPNKINKNILVDKSNILNYLDLLVLDAILLILNIILIIKGSKIQFVVQLETKVNKLKKLYEEFIIIVDALPNSDNLELINVKTFEDLLDLEQSLKIPIMYFDEDEDTKVFAIYTDKYLYRKIFDNDSSTLKEKKL